MASTVDLRQLEARIKLLLNMQLKNILRDQSLPVSGVKTELQIRLITHLNRLNATGDRARIDQIRNQISGHDNYPSPPLYSTAASPSKANIHTPAADGFGKSNSQHTMKSLPAAGRIRFKESPFYTIIQPVVPAVEVRPRETTKDNVSVAISLSEDVATKLQTDQQHKVMVFCAADTGLTSFSSSDIAFPHQVEIKINGDEVKANLRGLKNKVGSTRPADITPNLRKKPGYQNNLVMTWALTTKGSNNQKYFLVVNFVRKTPIDELVNRLKSGKSISKQQVLKEMKARAEDTDIVATSIIMSLKCPLSTLRIDVPCRSVSCKHNQCFDASSYLQLQEQAPTWTCPVCNKPAMFESLLFDQYVDDILRSTSRNTEQVTIEPEGQWSSATMPETPQSNTANSSMDDDDFVVLQPGRKSSAKIGSTPVPELLLNPFNITSNTPPLSSREESVASSARKASKRPASAIIDLTLSDDEEPPKPKQARPSLRGGGGPLLPDAAWHFDDPTQFPLPDDASSPNYEKYFEDPNEDYGYFQ